MCLCVCVCVCVCLCLCLCLSAQVQDLLAPYGPRSQVLRASFDEAFFFSFLEFRYVAPTQVFFSFLFSHDARSQKLRATFDEAFFVFISIWRTITSIFSFFNFHMASALSGERHLGREHILQRNLYIGTLCSKCTTPWY